MDLENIKQDSKTVCGNFLCERLSEKINRTPTRIFPAYGIEQEGLTCNGRYDCLNTFLDEDKELPDVLQATIPWRLLRPFQSL